MKAVRNKLLKLEIWISLLISLIETGAFKLLGLCPNWSRKGNNSSIRVVAERAISKRDRAFVAGYQQRR